ncbi:MULTISPECIES: hypothetical protein [unclassified Neisseria]|nr:MULTISPECIES: hypothetical protein [unclassified Neisseria]
MSETAKTINPFVLVLLFAADLAGAAESRSCVVEGCLKLNHSAYM